MDEALNNQIFSYFLAIPSLIAIILIVTICAFKRWRDLLWSNKLIFGVLTSLLIMNIIEVVTFGNISKNYNLLLRIYYCAAITSSSFIFCLSERLNNFYLNPRKLFFSVILAINIALISMLLASDLIVSGVLITQYTISRIPGDYYWCFQLFVLFSVSCGPILIWRSIKNANNLLDRKRHIVILIAFLPISATVLLVIPLMHFGIEINWSIFLPFCTLVFVIVYLFTENKNDLFKFLVAVPFSRERAAYKKLNVQVIEYISKTQTDEKLSLRQAMSEIEKTFISNALEIKHGNHNLAAELLSTSISTIYRNKGREADTQGPSD